MEIRLERLDSKNLPVVLDMQMTERQRREFLAPNIVSLAQCAAWQSEGRDMRALVIVSTSPIGFALLEKSGEELIIHRFMIDKQSQNQGAGTEALKFILAQQSIDCKIIRLTVFPENAAAVHIYEKLGFSASGEIKDGEAEYVRILL